MIPARMMRVPISLSSMTRWRRARVGVVGHVAHGSDSGGEVEEAVVVLHVGVHVPEAGEEGLAGGVDDLRPYSRPGAEGWTHAHNAILSYEDLLVTDNPTRLGVEEVGMGEYDS